MRCFEIVTKSYVDGGTFMPTASRGVIAAKNSPNLLFSATFIMAFMMISRGFESKAA